MIEIPKVVKAELDEIKTPSNRLLIIVLLLGIMTIGWLYITIVTSSTKDLKSEIEFLKNRIQDLEDKLVKKNETLFKTQEELSTEKRLAKEKVDLENARLMERILMQERVKSGLRK